MDQINEKILQASAELKNYLYFNKIEDSDIDKVNIQKSLYKLLRECIKNEVYTATVGDYTINIDPHNLSVIYETDSIEIEVSSEDIHYEQTHATPDEYFVISKTEEESYPINQPAIIVTGAIDVYDDIYREYYEISLSEDIEDDIRNYIILSNNFSYTNDQFDTKYTVVLSRNIKSTTPVFNIYNLFNSKVVKPVTYNQVDDNYLKRTSSINNKTYEDIVPSLSDKKLITSYLYGLVVDFYTDYINNNQ